MQFASNVVIYHPPLINWLLFCHGVTSGGFWERHPVGYMTKALKIRVPMPTNNSVLSFFCFSPRNRNKAVVGMHKNFIKGNRQPVFNTYPFISFGGNAFAVFVIKPHIIHLCSPSFALRTAESIAFLITSFKSILFSATTGIISISLVKYFVFPTIHFPLQSSTEYPVVIIHSSLVLTK
nr:MAG TPA: hypothetical protein [Caudoviricetes sp.]